MKTNETYCWKHTSNTQEEITRYASSPHIHSLDPRMPIVVIEDLEFVMMGQDLSQDPHLKP